MQPPRLDDLEIVVADGRRDDDDIRAPDVLGLVADRDRRPELRQAPRRLVGGEVRAGDLVAQVEEHLGDAVHARAADADHVDVFQLPVGCLDHDRFLIASPSARSTGPAIRSAASGFRSGSRFFSNPERRSGWSRKSRIRPASRSAVRSLSRRTSAPPAASRIRGVLGLMIVGRPGEGDEDRRLPGGDELGAGRRPGPADDEVGLREPVGHVVEERRDLGRLEAAARRSSARPRRDRPDPVWWTIVRRSLAAGEQGQGGRHRPVEETRALASAENEERQPPVRVAFGGRA